MVPTNAENDFVRGYTDECPHAYLPTEGDFRTFPSHDGIRWCTELQKRCAMETGDDQKCELAKLRKGGAICK